MTRPFTPPLAQASQTYVTLLLTNNTNDLLLILDAGLPGGEQRLALSPAPRGIRKVVAATSIAETSLTLPGVVYVVDCCFVKQRCYNPLLGLEALLIAPASKVRREGWARRSRQR